MTPKERLYARLAGQAVDRVPNLNIVMLFAAQHAGVKYGEFCADYRTLVRAQERTALDFGIDILSTMSDAYRETYDFGAPVEFIEDNLPICRGAVIKEVGDWKKLRHYDPLKSVRTLDRIRACELFKKDLGEAFPVLGWVEGSFAEFCDLTTVSEGLIMLMEDEAEVVNAFEFLLEQQIHSAQAQVDVGADFIGIGDAVASLVSPALYKRCVFPFEKRLIDAIHAMGARVKLHICGNINHILSDVIAAGADIVDIDFMVDLERSLKLAEGKCAICGNLNPATIIYGGTSAQVYEESLKILARAKDSKTFLFSGGCEVPRYTNESNMRAMQEALLKGDRL